MAASILILLGFGLPAAASAAPIPGIDVSHYQNDRGDIDWTQVADAGYRFTFIKATERDTYIDAFYGTNRSGAGDAGLRVGAYHFARPNGSSDEAVRKDARGEADHFLAIGAPAPGDLYPVLDVEGDLGGLDAGSLKIWIRTWLERVESGTGVKPLIYTSPYLWTNRLDDTQEFALAGNGLWVAHYTQAESPMVPADNWAGNGWSFWQYTSGGSVPGIKGNVDLNDGKAGTLKLFRIPVPPSVREQPEISGAVETGGTLTVSPGTWKGTKPVQLSYKWKRCDADSCQLISGATDAIYEIQRVDYGDQLKAVVTAKNEAGQASSATTPTGLVADGKAPDAAEVSSPEGHFSESRKLSVKWKATDDVDDDLTFDVRYRDAGKSGGFGSHTRWLTGADKRSAVMTGSPGRSYCFSSRATDDAENTSPWGEERCIAVRSDDRSLAGGGWEKKTGQGFYQGTYKQTSTRGATLKLKSVRGNSFDVLVSKCPGCGRIEIRFGGQVLEEISLDSTRERNRVAVEVATFGQTQEGTITIEVLSQEKRVRIDGLGVRRTP